MGIATHRTTLLDRSPIIVDIVGFERMQDIPYTFTIVIGISSITCNSHLVKIMHRASLHIQWHRGGGLRTCPTSESEAWKYAEPSAIIANSTGTCRRRR